MTETEHEHRLRLVDLTTSYKRERHEFQNGEIFLRIGNPKSSLANDIETFSINDPIIGPHICPERNFGLITGGMYKDLLHIVVENVTLNPDVRVLVGITPTGCRLIKIFTNRADQLPLVMISEFTMAWGSTQMLPKIQICEKWKLLVFCCETVGMDFPSVQI